MRHSQRRVTGQRRPQEPSQEAGLIASLCAAVRPERAGPPVRRYAVLLALTLVTLALTATPALAAPPETPELKVAPPVHATSAVLEGVLSPASTPSEGGEYSFLYQEAKAKTGCKGGVETTPGLDFGVEHQEVSEAISGLTASTEYTVCLLDKNLGGETLSAPVTFTTATPAEAPETSSPATAIAATEATFEGTVNPADEAVTGYFFAWAASGSCTEAGEGGASEPGRAGETESRHGDRDRDGPSAEPRIQVLSPRDQRSG